MGRPVDSWFDNDCDEKNLDRPRTLVIFVGVLRPGEERGEGREANFFGSEMELLPLVEAISTGVVRLGIVLVLFGRLAGYDW